MAGVKLSSADLEGATEIAPVKLSPEDLAGATAIDEPSSAPEQPGFFRKAAGTIWGGATAVGRELEGAAERAGHAIAHPVEYAKGNVEIMPYAHRRQLMRGVDDITTLGYGQKAADWAHRKLGEHGLPGGETASQQQESEAQTAAEAPDARSLGQAAGMALPSAMGAGFKAGGAAAAPLTSAIARGTSAVAERAATVPLIGRALAPAVRAAGGAAQGVAGYEMAAPVISAASADAEGHRMEAAGAAASDPSGLLLSGGAGAAPHVVGPLAHGAGKAVTNYVEHAPEAADAWVIKDLRGQSKGETTPTARKYLAADEADVQATLKRDPKLAETLRDARHSDRKKLEAAASALDSKISEVNTPRADLYDKHVDSALGGGIRAGDFVEKLRAAAEEKRADGTPGGHKMADYLDARAATLEKSKNWGAETSTEPARELSPELADQLHQLQKVRPNIKDPAVLAQLDEGIAKLQGGVKTTSKFNPDARVPARTARKVVTDIQDAAYDGLGGLADTRAAGHAREVAHDVSGVFNGFLDEAAAKSPDAASAVEQIRDINTQHSALKNIQKVIDQRLGKATENAEGAAGHVPHSLAAMGKKLGGATGAAVLYGTGHPVLAAATLGASALPEIKRFVDTKAAKLAGSPGYQKAVDRVARAAKASTKITDFVREASAAGLPVAEARRIYIAAHPNEKDHGDVVAGAP